MDASDQLSLETYTNTTRHEVDLTTDFATIADRLDRLSPTEYGSGATNIGGGIAQAIEELTSSRARDASRKVIVLLTDGIANIDEYGNHNVSGAKAHALTQAQRAADLGMRILAISVGQGADQDLMEQIANAAGGIHFHAEGEIDEYTAQMLDIFKQIGGARTVGLIE